MSNHLIYILPIITLLLFAIQVLIRGNHVRASLLFVLAFLPLMDLKITTEYWGGFKTFDAIMFYCLLFQFKEFVVIDRMNRNNSYFILFLLFSIIVLVSSLASEFPENTFLKFIKLLPIFIFARFFIKECHLDRSFFTDAVKSLKVGYVTALIFLIIQRFVGLQFTFYPELGPNTFETGLNLIRYPGVFYDSQASGQFLALGSFLLLYHPEESNLNGRLICYLLFVLSLVGIYWAGSRAALGGFLIGFIVMIIFANKGYRLFGAGLIVIGIIMSLFISTKQGMFARGGNISDDYIFRSSIWKKAYEITEDHPYLGIGIENYQKYLMRHAQDQYLEIKEGELLYFNQPENGYLKIMVELGFGGFFVFMLFILIPLLKGIIYRIMGYFDYHVCFFIAALVCFLVEFNTVYSIWDNRILILVVCVIGFIASFPYVSHRSDPEILENS